MKPLRIVFLAATLSACVSGAPKTTSLRIDGNVDDASVTIDDQLVGSVKVIEKRGVALPPGRHRISIEKPGFFPHDQLVDVKEGDPTVSLKIELERIPD